MAFWSVYNAICSRVQGTYKPALYLDYPGDALGRQIKWKEKSRRFELRWMAVVEFDVRNMVVK